MAMIVGQEWQFQGYTFPNTPSESCWLQDWDPTATPNSEVTVATEAALETALETAAEAGSGYHVINWTPTTYDTEFLFVDTPVNPPADCFIHIKAVNGCVLTERMRLNGVSNLIFDGFRWATKHSRPVMISSINPAGAGYRYAFINGGCGHNFKPDGDEATFDEYVNGFDMRECEVVLIGWDFNGISEGFIGKGGKFFLIDVFATDMIDDLQSFQCSGYGFTYAHIAAATVGALTAQAPDGPLHPDFVQTGANTDLAAEGYLIEVQQPCYVGSVIDSYRSQACFMKVEGTELASNILDVLDGVLLNTGPTGIALCDRHSRVKNLILARPPIAGPDEGSNGDPQQVFESRIVWPTTNSSTVEVDRGTVDVPEIDNIIASGHTDLLTRWENVNPTNFKVASFLTQTGPTSYPEVFPNIEGEWRTEAGKAQFVPTEYTGPQNRQDVRAFIAKMYEPAGGWAANSMTAPTAYAGAVTHIAQPGGLQAAINQAQPGDTVLLADGVHDEDITTVRAGTAARPIFIKGESYNAKYVGGSAATRSFTVNHSHIHLSGFTMDGLHDPASPDVEASYRAKLLYIEPPVQDGSEYLYGVKVTRMDVKNSLTESLRFRFVKDLEVGYIRQRNAGLKGYKFNNGSLHNGEGIYIGTSPSQLTGTQVDQSTYHVHHIDADFNSEAVNTKEGTLGIIEFVKATRSQQDTVGAINAQDTATIRYCLAHDNLGSGIRAAASNARLDGVTPGENYTVEFNEANDNGDYGYKFGSTTQTSICGNTGTNNSALTNLPAGVTDACPVAQTSAVRGYSAEDDGFPKLQSPILGAILKSLISPVVTGVVTEVVQ